MTMHLAHPSLSLSGKKKGKQKFKSAEAARKARELDASWQELQKKWDVDADDRRRKRAMAAEPLNYKLTTPVGRTTSRDLPSRVTPGGSTAPVHKVYTGDKVLGIATMHKSNAVPVIDQAQMEEISRMRRG